MGGVSLGTVREVVAAMRELGVLELKYAGVEVVLGPMPVAPVQLVPLTDEEREQAEDDEMRLLFASTTAPVEPFLKGPKR